MIGVGSLDPNLAFLNPRRTQSLGPSATVECRVPLFYVLDSILKNVGGAFTFHAEQHIHRFVHATQRGCFERQSLGRRLLLRVAAHGVRQGILRVLQLRGA